MFSVFTQPPILLLGSTYSPLQPTVKYLQSTKCPESLEPMGILFIIYVICSICSPWHSMHFLSRFTMFVWILLNILGWTVAQQSVILCLRWRRSRILTAYTCAFRNPQNAKSPPFYPMLMPFVTFNFNLYIKLRKIIEILIGSRLFEHLYIILLIHRFILHRIFYTEVLLSFFLEGYFTL
jgi:hypothetical protein